MLKLNGKLYKDLSLVQKQLSKVIILDNNPDVVFQKENCVKIKSFEVFDQEDFELKKFVDCFKNLIERNKIENLKNIVKDLNQSLL